MSEAIEATKDMIMKYLLGRKRYRIDSFLEYDKVYGTTTENIEGYLKLCDFKDKERAITVLASGDQTFSLAARGIKDIITFDINKLTEYYALGLKRAAIQAFSYEEFISYFEVLFSDDTSLIELTDMVKFLLPYMDKEYREYWREVIEFNFKEQEYQYKTINLFRMIFYSTAHGISKLKNSYLITKERYDYLKSVIGNVNITYDAINVFDVPNMYEKEQDFILLSNIADYLEGYLGNAWTYNDLRKEILKFHKLLKPEGIIFIAYLIGKHEREKQLFACPMIYPSLMKPDDLTTEELILVPHIDNDHVSERFEDGVILERVIK